MNFVFRASKTGIFKNPNTTGQLPMRKPTPKAVGGFLPGHFRQRYVEGFAKSQGNHAGWPHYVEFLSEIVALKNWFHGKLAS